MWHLAVGIWHKNVVSSDSTQHLCFQHFKVKTLTSHEEEIKVQKIIWLPLISFFYYSIIWFYYHHLHSYIAYGDFLSPQKRKLQLYQTFIKHPFLFFWSVISVRDLSFWNSVHNTTFLTNAKFCLICFCYYFLHRNELVLVATIHPRGILQCCSRQK